MEQDGDQHNKNMVVHVHRDEESFSLLGPAISEFSGHLYDKPRSYFGCGIGWFSFIFGFVFPPIWYYATLLYFANYRYKDPRERPGLAASAIAALICSVYPDFPAWGVFLKMNVPQTSTLVESSFLSLSRTNEKPVLESFNIKKCSHWEIVFVQHKNLM